MECIGMVHSLWFVSWLLFNHGGLIILIQRLSWICLLSLASKNGKKLTANISGKIFLNFFNFKIFNSYMHSQT